MQDIKSIDEKVNPEMKKIYQLLIKYGNSAKDATAMIKKNLKYVNKTYRNSTPRAKAVALVGLQSLGESVNEGKYTVHFDVGSSGLMSKTVNAKNAKDAARQVASGLKGGAKLIRKIEKESINEAPGKSGKDQYVGAARVKVEPYTYKDQKRDFHDVSMYRDHKKPYNYYLSIRLAHSNKIDMVVDTGTHIQSKAGKWAQGFMKRRMDGTGKERFS